MTTEDTAVNGAKSKTISPLSATLLQLDPASVLLITDEKHPLYDARAEAKADEALVSNIMAYGVLQPITVRKNDAGQYEVIAGRRRTIALREANKRLVKKGRNPLPLPATEQHSLDLNNFGQLCSENEQREEDTILGRAFKLEKYYELGGDDKGAATTFGYSPSTIRNYRLLVKLHPAVQKAVQKGDIGAVLAYQEFSKLEAAEQPEALKKLLAAGTTKGAAAKANTKKAAKGEATTARKVRCRPAKEVQSAIRKLKKEVEGPQSETIVAAMKWCLGSDSALNSYKRIEECLYPPEKEEAGEK